MSVDDTAAITRICTCWFKFRSLASFLAAKDVDDACVRSCMLYGSETVFEKRKWTGIAFARNVNDWVDVWCNIKGWTVLCWIKAVARNRRQSKSGTNKKIAIVWTCFIEGMMINWGERCVTLEVEGTKQRDRPRNTWKEVVDKAMNHFALKLRTERCYGSS